MDLTTTTERRAGYVRGTGNAYADTIPHDVCPYPYLQELHVAHWKYPSSKSQQLKALIACDNSLWVVFQITTRYFVTSIGNSVNRLHIQYVMLPDQRGI
jgi:hypothetical protein